MDEKLEFFNNLFKCLTLKNNKGLKILLYIKSHEGCNVKQIYESLNFDQVTTSVILNEIKKLGFIEVEKQWYNRIYKITDPVLISILEVIENMK